MTAREFLEYAHIETPDDRSLLAALYDLTCYLDSDIDFSEFPDADIPDEVWQDADEPARFQEYFERASETCSNCRYYGDEKEGCCGVGNERPEPCSPDDTCSQFTRR